MYWQLTSFGPTREASRGDQVFRVTVEAGNWLFATRLALARCNCSYSSISSFQCVPEDDGAYRLVDLPSSCQFLLRRIQTDSAARAVLDSGVEYEVFGERDVPADGGGTGLYERWVAIDGSCTDADTCKNIATQILRRVIEETAGDSRRYIVIQLFDHKFALVPRRAPVVVTSWKEWREDGEQYYFPNGGDVVPDFRSVEEVDAPIASPVSSNPSQSEETVSQRQKNDTQEPKVEPVDDDAAVDAPLLHVEPSVVAVSQETSQEDANKEIKKNPPDPIALTASMTTGDNKVNTPDPVNESKPLDSREPIASDEDTTAKMLEPTATASAVSSSTAASTTSRGNTEPEVGSGTMAKKRKKKSAKKSSSKRSVKTAQIARKTTRHHISEGGIMDAFEKMQDMYVLKRHDDVASFALTTVLDLLPSAAGLTMLLKPGSDRFYVSVTEGKMFDGFRRKEFSQRHGVVGFVSKSSHLFSFDAPADDRRFKLEEVFQQAGDITNMLCVPIANEGHWLGVVILVNKNGDTGYSTADCDTVSYICGAVGEYLDLSLPSREKGFSDSDFALN